MRYQAPTASTSELQVSVKKLTAGYGTKTIIRDFALELPQGITVIVGPGGSGKSTLVRAVCGFKGEDFWARGIVSIPTSQIAFQHQIPRVPARTLAELVVPMASLADVGELGLQKLALQTMSNMPATSKILEPHLACSLSELPRPLLRLAQFFGVSSRPAACYIFDEPDGDLPEEQIAEVEVALAQLGRCSPVLLVTHHLSLGRRLADQAVLVEDGQLVEAGSGKDFFSRPQKPRTQQFLRYGS